MSSVARRLPAIVAALALVSCVFDSVRTAGTGSSTESGTLGGRIVSENGKDPVAGAVVTLLPSDHVPSIGLAEAAPPPTAVTDAEGNYRFRRVPPGIYNLLAGKGELKSFRDSLTMGDSAFSAGVDTLRPAGALHGVVQLQPGDDPRTVLIPVLGTTTLAYPGDPSGAFAIQGLAAGEYRVRFLSTIDDYGPIDTLLRVRSGFADTLAAPIRLPFRGIPGVEYVEAGWDPLLQQVTVRWMPADTALVTGYYVYRAPAGTPFGATPVNASVVQDTVFVDSAAPLDGRYAYAVRAVDRNGNAGPRLSAAASVSTPAMYRLAGTLVLPSSSDQTPLAVSRGEIFWLTRYAVEVFDTLGSKIRTIGGSGAGKLSDGSILRIIRDTVYVVDLVEPALNPVSRLKRFTRQGVFVDSLELGGLFSTFGAGDFWKSLAGKFFVTNGSKVYAVSASGGVDSTPSPLVMPPRGVQKLEPLGDNILLMNAKPGETGGPAGYRHALMRQADLRVARLDSALAPGFGGFATNGRDRIVMSLADRAEVMSENFSRIQKVALPGNAYADIAWDEDGNLFLFDGSSKAIQFFRKQ